MIEKNLLTPKISRQIQAHKLPIDHFIDLFGITLSIMPVEEKQKLLEISDIEEQVGEFLDFMLNRSGKVFEAKNAISLKNLTEEMRIFSPERIVRLRKSNNLSRAELANWLDVSPTTVRRWETGQSKPSGMANKLLTLVEKKVFWIDVPGNQKGKNL